MPENNPTTEIWKDIPGYERLYQVSDQGRVRRIGAIKGCRAPDVALKPVAGRAGYLRVSLHKKLIFVHRLVILAFIGPIPKGLEPNHKNGVPSDNRLENLELVTKSENRLHAYRELGQQHQTGSLHGRSKLTEAQVLEIRRLGANREWGIGTKLAKQFGVGPQIISFILNRKNWTHI